MRAATNLGLAAAILLITTLIAGAMNSVISELSPLKCLGAGSAAAGFALATVENSIIRRALHGELLDVPDLAHRSGQTVGDITDPTRGAH